MVGLAVEVIVKLRDQARPLRFLQGGDGGRVIQRGRLRQQGGVEPLADQRRDREDLGAPVRQPPQPRPHHVTDGFRDLRQRFAERQVPCHLQEEERVARGLPPQFGDHRGLAVPEQPPRHVSRQHGVRQHRRQQPGDVLVRQAAQREAAAVDVPCQGGQDGGEVVPLRPGVPVHGGHQQRRGTLGPHQVRQQEQRGLVRPLQVVEDEQHGPPGGDPRDPGVERLEQTEALGLGAQRRYGGHPDAPRGLGAQDGDLPGEACQVPAQHRVRAGTCVVPQGFTEGLIGGEDVLVPATVEHQAPVRAHPARQFGHQGSLADPGLAGGERQDAAARRRARPCLPEHAEFPVTPHEPAAGGGLDPHDVRRVGVIRAVVQHAPAGDRVTSDRVTGDRMGGDRMGGHRARRLRRDHAAGRAHGRAGFPPGHGHEPLACVPRQLQGAGQQFGGGLARRQVDATLQVADRSRAHSRGGGQFFLGEHGLGPPLTQQFREPDRRLLRHSRFPFADHCFRVPSQIPDPGYRAP